MVQEKKRIGTAAVEFVANGNAIYIDASSTVLALVKRK
jgi:DeoR/GlpR family transcriptional regulator of sugar metabolism